MTKKPIQINPQIEDPADDTIPNLPIDVKRFIDESGLNDSGYTVYVYRIDRRPGPGRSSRSFVNQYENEIPQFSFLGEKYGAGYFEMYVRWYDNDGQSKSKKITIQLDESWDKIKADIDSRREMNSVVQKTAAPDMMQIMSQGVLMVRAVTEAIAPLLNPLIQKKENSSANNESVTETLKQMASMGSSMLMSNFNNGLAMQQTMLEKMGSMTAVSEPPQDDTLDRLLKTVDRLLPLFTAMSDKQIKPVAMGAAETNPELQELLNNPQRLRIAYSRLVEQHGEESANRIMKAFGVFPKQQKSPHSGVEPGSAENAREMASGPRQKAGPGNAGGKVKSGRKRA